MTRRRVDQPHHSRAPRTVRMTAPLREDLYRRAQAIAAVRGQTLGALVSEALEAHLRGSYVVDRGSPVGVGGGVGADGPHFAFGPANVPVITAARGPSGSPAGPAPSNSA